MMAMTLIFQYMVFGIGWFLDATAYNKNIDLIPMLCGRRQNIVIFL